MEVCAPVHRVSVRGCVLVYAQKRPALPHTPANNFEWGIVWNARFTATFECEWGINQ